ncbi:MAG TPA: hypothetical protein VNY75_02015 [Rhizomicrobium sp.]|nr:hypothetical protein [Rhizomicrobium sp.]
MNRLLYAAIAASLLGSSAAIAQSEPPSDRNPSYPELSNPEPSAQNSTNRDLTNQTSRSDDQNELATGGREGTSPKANIINPEVTVRNVPPLPPGNKTKLMGGERELTAGLLSKDASFRLIVSGPVGASEIQRLIVKLELEKGILAASDGAAE